MTIVDLNSIIRDLRELLRRNEGRWEPSTTFRVMTAIASLESAVEHEADRKAAREIARQQGWPQS